MTTLRQRLALKKILESGSAVGPAMLEVGYSPTSSKNPKLLTDSKGFKDLLEEQGLTPELIIGSLVEDITKKPQKRVGELSLGADILGLKKKNDVNVGVQVNFGTDKTDYA